MKPMQQLRRLAAAVLCASLSSAAFAAWPDDKPIELVVGFGPGGGTDIMARTLGKFAEKRLGPNVRIVVVNKPGAGGELAAAHVAQAKPDGYTLGMINVPGFIFLPMVKKSSYQPEQLRLIARLVEDPSLIIAKRDPKVPVELKAIVQALTKDPKSLSFGHSGDGTTGHLALMQLERLTGIKANAIPFKGSTDAKLALLGGHIDYAVVTTGEALDIDQPGTKFLGIAQASAKRGVNKIPTTVEAGFDVRMSSERGIGGPRALPDDIAMRLQKVIAEVFRDPEFLAAAKNDAPVLAFLGGEEWTRLLNQNRQALLPLVPLMEK